MNIVDIAVGLEERSVIRIVGELARMVWAREMPESSAARSVSSAATVEH
jgi:hypothetical protein